MWYITDSCGNSPDVRYTASLAILGVRISGNYLNSYWRRCALHYIKLGYYICFSSTDAGTCRRCTQHDHPTREDGVFSNKRCYSRQCNISQSSRSEDITFGSDGGLQSRLLVLLRNVLRYHATLRLGTESYRQAGYKEAVGKCHICYALSFPNCYVLRDPFLFLPMRCMTTGCATSCNMLFGEP